MFPIFAHVMSRDTLSLDLEVSSRNIPRQTTLLSCNVPFQAILAGDNSWSTAESAEFSGDALSSTRQISTVTSHIFLPPL